MLLNALIAHGFSAMRILYPGHVKIAFIDKIIADFHWLLTAPAVSETSIEIAGLWPMIRSAAVIPIIAFYILPDRDMPILEAPRMKLLNRPLSAETVVHFYQSVKRRRVRINITHGENFYF
ncbi:MAG: hypothetical protein ACU837_00770 [Gammaproteobacteria bacterium]